MASSFWEGFEEQRELSREELSLYQHAISSSPIWDELSARQQDYLTDEFIDAMAANDIEDMIDWLNTLETDWPYADWAEYRLMQNTDQWDQTDWEVWRAQYG